MKPRAQLLGPALGCLLAAAPVTAQQAPSEVGARLRADPTVQAALVAVERNAADVLEEQVRLCEIPAPPFGEAARAEAMKAAFEALGLADVHLDAVGNVIGVRPGRAARPNLVLAAHLDTVFPEGTDVRVERDGSRLVGPGIGDDCLGLATLIGVARALNEAGLETPGTITFVANVGEEGLGDLRGTKNLFEHELAGRIDRFVSVDGAGYGITRVGVGSYRYRITFHGPGGHSYGAFGLASPVHALGRAIAQIADFDVPKDPKTTFTVGRIGGGTSVNSIAFEAWAEIDLRSDDRAALDALERRLLHVVDAAVTVENARWGGRRTISVDKERVGVRPPGQTPLDSPIVQAAISVTRALGLPVRLETGSTDANVPMGLGVPAVTIDGGGKGSGAHSLAESLDTTDYWKGTQRALLLAVALAHE